MEKLQTLLRSPDLRLGLVYVNPGSSPRRDGPRDMRLEGIRAVARARPAGRSLLLSDGKLPACSATDVSCYEQAFEGSEPLIVGDLTEEAARSPLERQFLRRGFRSLLVRPLYVDNQVVGILELASPRPNDLGPHSATRRMEGLVLAFATAMKREQNEEEDRIQLAIKTHFTAVHPSVEWRFRKAAIRMLDAQRRGESSKAEPILFEDVHGLYGLSDIRDSSVHRAAAVQADLGRHLDLAHLVLQAARRVRPRPALGELAFRTGEYRTAIQKNVGAADEASILAFLQQEFEPLLDVLAGYGDDVKMEADAYREALDPRLGSVYQARKQFDESVAMINETI